MNIPAELKALPQWVLWRYENRDGPKPIKRPYSVSGFPCDITKPENCASFDAVMAVKEKYDGIGIVLFRHNNITAGDLDNPFQSVEGGQIVTVTPEDGPAYDAALSVLNSHLRIVQHLNTYTEWSPSGYGLRTFCFGVLPPEWGKRNAKVELYCEARFVTVTGREFVDERAPHSSAIEHRQYALEELGRSIGLDKTNTGANFESQPETRTDDEVLEAICRSKIGEKFLPLYNGEFAHTGDGSANDQSLANFICYFTDSKEQAYRIFLSSGHFRARTKLHDRTEYLVQRVINNGFDKKPPKINFDALRSTLQAPPAAEIAPSHNIPAAVILVPTPSDVEDDLSRFPPGLLGMIAEYIYNTAPYGVAEYALAGAIGLLAGMAGRAFNYSGNGLNQYIVVVGRSGSGKDSISSGITRLLAEFDTTIPAARLFQGPRSIASAPALNKMFDRDRNGQPSMVCIMPEFGEWLQLHLDPRADATKKALVAEFMDIYSKSTKGNEAGSRIYSDSDNNVKAAKSPSFTFIGDTVPSTFYEACTEAYMEKGLLPRLLVIERTKQRPDLNKSHYLWRANDNFLTNFGMFITHCMALNEKNNVTQVAHTAEAAEIIEAFRLECDRHYRNPGSEAAGNMWSRGHVKAMRLAALAAVGVHWFKPVIDADQAHWAVALAKRDILNMLKRVSTGEIETKGTEASGGYSVEQKSLATVYVAHIDRPYDRLNAQHQAQVNPEAHAAGFMRASTFRNMAGQKPVFRKDPRNKQRRIAETIKEGFSGVLRVTTGADLLKSDATAVHRFNLSLEVEYVVCTDRDEMRRLSAPDA